MLSSAECQEIPGHPGGRGKRAQRPSTWAQVHRVCPACWHLHCQNPRSPCGDEGWAGMVFQAVRAEVLGDSISESIYPTETKGRARWQGSSWQNGLRDRVGVEENYHGKHRKRKKKTKPENKNPK